MRININGIEWKIIFTNNPKDLMRTNGTITLGITDLKLKTIFLYNKLHGNLLRKVMMHEITHAFIFSYNFYLTLAEEEFICSFIDTYADDIINDTNYLLNMYFQNISL